MKKVLEKALLLTLLVGTTQVVMAAPAADGTGTTAGATATTPAVDITDFPTDHNGLTINGAVGLPLNPTAHIPNRGSWRVQGDFFDLGEVDTTGEDSSDFTFWGLHIAGRPWSFPVEISGGVEKLSVDEVDDLNSNDADNTGLAIGAKWQVWRNEGGDAFVALGAGYSRVLAKNIHAYLVGTKVFRTGRRNWTAHLGARFDRFDVDDVSASGDDSNKVSIYGGLEVPIDRNGRWNFVGELQSKNNDFDDSFFTDVTSGDAKFPYSASIRYQNQGGWAASLGIQRLGYPGLTNDSGLFAQVGKTF